MSDDITVVVQSDDITVVVDGPGGALPLPSVSSRIGKFLAFDAEGNPVAADGTGTDDTLRGALAASTGLALVGFSGGGSADAALATAGTAASGAAAAAAVLATTPPYNLAPNSQFEIVSGMTYAMRMSADGTGTLPTASLASNTTGSNTVTLTLTAAVPASWLPGHLVIVDGGGGATPELTVKPMRIQSISGSTLVVRCPFNLAPATSVAGNANNVHNVAVGGSASVGTGDAADGWQKTAATTIWRDDYAANRVAGALYSLGVNKAGSGAELVYLTLDVARHAGTTRTFGCWVAQSRRATAATWRLFFNSDGTGGGYVTGTVAAAAAGFQWLEFSHAIPADATYASCGVQFDGAAGDVYYLCNPVLAGGGRIGTGNYVKPREDFIPIVHLDVWTNVTVTFPDNYVQGLGATFAVDFYADSGGAVAPSVRLIDGSIEGINTGTVFTGIGGAEGGPRLLGFYDGTTGAISLGGFGLGQIVANVRSQGVMRVPLKNGVCIAGSGQNNDVWQNVSIDFDRYHLE